MDAPGSRCLVEDTGKMPVVGPTSPVRGLESLLSFLLACAEASPGSENYDIFDDEVREWARWNQDALMMAHLEVKSIADCGHNRAGESSLRCVDEGCDNFM